MNETKKRGNANLPALILLAVLLMFWQAAAMGIDAAYILPSPTQILDPSLGTARSVIYSASSGYHVGSCHRTFHFYCSWTGTCRSYGYQ